ncbi:heat shock 70 kDa protein 12A-like [Mytilus galloprovincialis]|uniref:heat shock 70 kDa protein 12A-like n=1 Tax=Mytilus galloprovincialis TaxID=29158 RepID=UPI003F7CBE11
MNSENDIIITRQQNGTFGFTVKSSKDGCFIDSQAEHCGKLHGDKIIAVNGKDVRSLEHNEIVTLIKESREAVSIRLIHPGRTTDEQQMASSLEHGRHKEDNNATTISKPRKQSESPNVLNFLDTDSESDEEIKQLQLEYEKIKRQKKKEKKDMMKQRIEREKLQYQQLTAEKQKFEKQPVNVNPNETVNSNETNQRTYSKSPPEDNNEVEPEILTPNETVNSDKTIKRTDSGSSKDYYEDIDPQQHSSNKSAVCDIPEDGSSYNNYILVAALDFGTTFSGFAFSLRSDFSINPLHIYSKASWNAGGRQLLSLKTPTCLLLDAKKSFVGFGYEAENKYIDIVIDKEQDDYYYFYRFKMELFHKKDITKDITIKDVTGKSIPAIEVFSLSIKALKDCLFELAETCGFEFTMKDIKWVLTVPAIWSDSAKEFMKESAIKAGIPSNQIYLALEPEAASIYGQYFTANKIQDGGIGEFIVKPGTKFMVADLGGGTADIIVQEKLENGRLKELHHASGNDCGGTSVDKSYLKIFEVTMGPKAFEKLQKDDPSVYLDLCREFEVLKRSISPSKTGKINITIPIVGLNKICKKYAKKKDFEKALDNSPYSDTIKVFNDKVRIDASFVKSLFTPTIAGIITIINKILTSVSGVTQILLVGGFSECKLVQDAVIRSFGESNKIKVIVPMEAGMSVLKGAVLFGHKPNYIVSRKMRYTYGIQIIADFNKDIHERKYMHRVKGKQICTQLFEPVVKLNDTVEIGKQHFSTISTNREFQPELFLPIYCSTEANPMFTDEEGCTKLGKVKMVFPKPSKEKRKVQVCFIFGHTELQICAVDLTSGQVISSQLNLL